MKLLTVIGLLLCAVFACAHDLTVDNVRIIQNGEQAIVSLGIHKSDPLAPNPDAAIRNRLHILQNGNPVEIGKQVSSTEKSEDLTYWQAELKATDGGEFSLQGPLRPERKEMTTVLLVFQNGLLATQKTYKAETETLGGFFRLGIEHLLAGLDHILFVLSLVLVARRFKEIAKVVTAFTVAHCCTLALVVLKGFTISPKIVEPLIALSIAVVALQALRKVPLSTRGERDLGGEAIYIAFGFGLIHGFGFAGGLVEKGFDRANVWSALLSFNIGLELAQLTIASLGFVALTLLSRKPKLQLRITQLASLSFALVALFWFVQRVFGA
jgi:hydrogenase/urease accessory protein HupE